MNKYRKFWLIFLQGFASVTIIKPKLDMRGKH